MRGRNEELDGLRTPRSHVHGLDGGSEPYFARQQHAELSTARSAREAGPHIKRIQQRSDGAP